MKKILRKAFFNRDTDIVAKELLGKFLVRQFEGKIIAVMITETEAYDGLYDKASHASKGRTLRTEVMFGHPGIFYVCLCYGMYYMLNVVTREHNYPAAVLIREVEGASGPGKLTKLLHINKTLNHLPAEKSSGLWLEDRGVIIPNRNIKKTPRIGVQYAGPIQGCGAY